jgi:hypothetical protein
MSVEFEGDEHTQSNLYAKYVQQNQVVQGLSGWLIKKGIASSPEAANRVLVVVMVLCFLLTGYFGYKSIFTTNVPLKNSEKINPPPFVIKK